MGKKLIECMRRILKYIHINVAQAAIIIKIKKDLQVLK